MKRILIVLAILVMTSLACNATAGATTSDSNTPDYTLNMNDDQQVPICDGKIVTMNWIKVHEDNKVDVNLKVGSENKDVSVQKTALIGGYNFINWGDRVEVECNP